MERQGLVLQCVILVDGLGARSGERTNGTSRSRLKLEDPPFLELLISEARRRGCDEFVFLAGHRSEIVRSFLAQRDIARRFRCRVQAPAETVALGTGGALVHAEEYLHDDFLLLNGDTWFDFNWLDLVVSARHDRAGAAMALREISSKSISSAGLPVRGFWVTARE